MPKIRAQNLPLKSGVLVWVDSTGVGIIEESSSQKQYGFTFDKVPGYRGQPAEKIGLQPGKTIEFTADGESIKSVFPGISNPTKSTIPG